MSGVSNINNVRNFFQSGDVQKSINDSKNSRSPVNSSSHSEKANSTEVKSKIADIVVSSSSDKKQVFENITRPNDSPLKSDSQNRAQSTGAPHETTGKERDKFSKDMGDKGNIKTSASGSDAVRDRNHTSQEHGPGKDDDTKTSENRPGRGQVGINSSRVNRRRDDDEDDEDGQRRRRKQATFLQQQRKPLTILEGAKVAESQSQDMFIASSVHAERINGRLNKTVVEQLKEYDLTPYGCDIYDVVYANANGKEKNGIGPNMQKDLYAEIMKGMSEVDDVMTPAYKRLVRDVVQGTMQAALDTHTDMRDMVKMLVSGFMAMSPHDDDPQIMSAAIKTIVSEVMYGKVNIGYNMKSAASYLGSALHTLQLYYRYYQKDIEFTKDLEQTINSAFSEAIWSATGEISNYSQVSAKANIEQFMAGKLEDEKAYNKSIVKDMVLSPLKRVFNKGS